MNTISPVLRAQIQTTHGKSTQLSLSIPALCTYCNSPRTFSKDSKVWIILTLNNQHFRNGTVCLRTAQFENVGISSNADTPNPNHLKLIQLNWMMYWNNIKQPWWLGDPPLETSIGCLQKHNLKVEKALFTHIFTHYGDPPIDFQWWHLFQTTLNNH